MSSCSYRVFACTLLDKTHVFHQASEGYHPERSQVSPDSLAQFLRAPITGDLHEVQRPSSFPTSRRSEQQMCVCSVGSRNWRGGNLKVSA